MSNRRKFLGWSAVGAVMLGLPGQAWTQVSATPDDEPRSPMNRAFEENLVMLAELTVKPERLDEFLDYTVENLKLSRSYPGNLAFDILIDEARPGQVIFYEVWETPKAQQDYMAWRVQAGDLTKLMSFLADKPRFTALRSIAS